MFGLLNIFENFLPHLLRYANPSDPLNTEASNLMTKDESRYNETVKKYVQQYAKNNPDVIGKDEDENDDDEDDELSDVGSLSSNDEDEDDEMAGEMEM